MGSEMCIRDRAELGTSFPAEGGIYVWIKRAFGQRWATRAVWAYWINTAIWLPAIYILFAGILSRLLQVELGIPTAIGIGIALAWLTVAVDLFGLKIGKWIPNLGAVLKMIIFIVLIIGGFRYAASNGYANDISVRTLTPSWADGLKFLPVIIYGMLGFELVSAAGSEIRQPEKTVPRAILFSGVLILALYSLATLGILAAIPVTELDIVDGLIDTLNLFFGQSSQGALIVTVLGIGALYTFWSNGATWAMGCNRAIAEAAAERQLPAAFAYSAANSDTTQTSASKQSAPQGAAILMGIVCTAALILYGGLASTNEDLFWSLFSFSAVIFMLPYIGMVLAFAKLRFSEPTAPRPFRVAGGTLGACLLSGICVIILFATIALFPVSYTHLTLPTKA